jgi:hypothetical protein
MKLAIFVAVVISCVAPLQASAADQRQCAKEASRLTSWVLDSNVESRQLKGISPAEFKLKVQTSILQSQRMEGSTGEVESRMASEAASYIGLDLTADQIRAGLFRTCMSS